MRFQSDKMGPIIHGRKPWEIIAERLSGLVDNLTVVGIDCLGGFSRRESLINGLKYVTEDRVLIADAARVLVARRDFEKLASADGHAIAFGRPAVNTPIMSVLERWQTIPRAFTYEVHTPQLFHTDLLEELILHDDGNHPDEWSHAASIPDFANLCELVDGSFRTSFKLTYPDDLEVALQLSSLKLEACEVIA